MLETIANGIIVCVVFLSLAYDVISDCLEAHCVRRFQLVCLLLLYLGSLFMFFMSGRRSVEPVQVYIQLPAPEAFEKDSDTLKL